MTQLIAKQNKIKKLARSAVRPKAWAVQVKKPRLGQFYFFKGRFGKRAKSTLLDGTKAVRGVAFKLQPKESGYVTTSQLEVLWRAVRRRTRRFTVNLRRTPASTRLQLTASCVQTQRKKGGRMGSGKSPVTGVKAALKCGKIFFFSSEFRKRPLLVFLAFRSVLKKISLKSSVKYTF